MLNKNNERELAYVVIIDNITSIEGYDRVELAHVKGWTIVVGKGEFKIGDPAIYFEIDSKLPSIEPFINMEFLAKKKFKIKTQKMCKSISQGLLMSADNFGWKIEDKYIIDDKGVSHNPNDESKFLTKELNVTYYVPEDNIRKRKTPNKYDRMIIKYNKLFKHQPFKWIIKHSWGKKFLFIFFGRNIKNTSWPEWVKKTDEERVENMPWILTDKESWIATEKIDGTSTTFTIKRSKRGKYEFYVCSRNVVFDKPNKQCFYDSNVYIEMAEKYNMEANMKDMLETHPEWDWVTIQGETFGKGIQKNEYALPDHEFRIFNLITSDKGRWNSLEMENYLYKNYGLWCVPIIESNYKLPDTIEELREYVKSGKSYYSDELREGIVFRSHDGTKSFKCVDPDYLIKYH